MSIETVPLRPLARAKARNYRKHRSVSPAPAQVLVSHAAEDKLGSAQDTVISDTREEAQILSRPPRYFEAEEEEARAEEAAGLLGSKDTDQISGRQSEHWSTERGSTEPQGAGVPIASGFGFRMLRSMGWVRISITQSEACSYDPRVFERNLFACETNTSAKKRIQQRLPLFARWQARALV